MSIRTYRILGGVFAVLLPGLVMALDDDYADIRHDLSDGIKLQEIADRAHQHSEDYWEYAHGHERDGHDHPEHDTDQHDGIDEELSAGEAVTEIFHKAGSQSANVDLDALDIVEVTIAVIDAWPDCEDTFDAVRAAVELMPGRADEIVARVATKRDCNCSNGGIWLDQRLSERIRVAMRHNILDTPTECSCSQVAMYAGIAGLPENREFNPDLSEELMAELAARMTERVTTIIERTAALQSKNGWECGCTSVNIAASMQGIGEDELRADTFDSLAKKYTDEAGDTGLVVDSFGVVGLYPREFWGDDEYKSRDNSLRRNPDVYRGDNLILDPFNPATEFQADGDRNFEHVGRHVRTTVYKPTDLIISEYIEGWNSKALASPASERDPEQRNRVIELYNGSENTIDLADDLYFLEIYTGPGTATTHVAMPPKLVRKTISLQSDVTFEFDKADIRAEANEQLGGLVRALNDADLFSEILITGHTCDLGSEEYNLELSARRAKSVKNFFQEHGLQVGTIRTEGHGEREPRVPNDSEADRRINRRVEVTFVTRAGEEIEAKVSAGEAGEPRRYDYTFTVPSSSGVDAEVNSQAVAHVLVEGEYEKGDMVPRQVIGLHGAIEPGATYLIVFSESDEMLTDAAQMITPQLDFKPNETLLLRRLGGEMALNCGAFGYAYVANYEALPLVRLPPPPRAPDGVGSISSPN